MKNSEHSWTGARSTNLTQSANNTGLANEQRQSSTGNSKSRANQPGSFQITLACFRPSMSSSTDDRIRPPCRLGGSSTFKVSSRGVTSTPNSSRLRFSIGFFLAFMMFGSVAYLGSLSRKSVLRDQPERVGIGN